MPIWRELGPGDDGKNVYPLYDSSSDLFAALIPVDESTITGLADETDYWCGAHPDNWPSSFTLEKVVRSAPTTLTEATSYTEGSTTVSKWHSRALQKFVGTSTSHAWSTGRCWKAVVPALRTTIDHYIYIVWNGTDFEWLVTTEDTADYIDVDTSGFEFTETSLSVVGVKATDV